MLHGNSEFKNNRYLQNLLILTAIKADKASGPVSTLDT